MFRSESLDMTLEIKACSGNLKVIMLWSSSPFSSLNELVGERALHLEELLSHGLILLVVLVQLMQLGFCPAIILTWEK